MSLQIRRIRPRVWFCSQGGLIDLIRGKFYVASRRVQFLELFCLLFTLMTFLMSLFSLNLYCLLMPQVSCSHKDANHLVSIVNNELAKIIIWLKVNELSLNLTKTNFMIFHPRQKKVSVNVPLTLENTVIKQVTETKFLGVLIDQHLSWKPHIEKKFPKEKISKSVGIIAEASFYLSAQTLMTLYYSLVYPFLTYCNVALSSTYCSNLNCIYLLQKRLVRLIRKRSLSSKYRPFI